MTLGPASNEHGPSRHEVVETPRDTQLLAKVSLLQGEMFETLAPAADGPIVAAGRRRRGRLVFGDALD